MISFVDAVINNGRYQLYIYLLPFELLLSSVHLSTPSCVGINYRKRR